MATTVQKQLMTAEELLRMPDNGLRTELVRGELRTMAPANHTHGYLTVNVTIALAHYVKAKNLGRVYAAETGFILERDPDTVRAPDVAFIRRERLPEAEKTEGYWPGPPDLAVEVISPSEAYVDVEEKVYDWLNTGTRMVVVVNPRKRLVTVYRSISDMVILTDKDTLDGGDVVPGWTMAVADIFA
jgi:Uma2 family endonuclease